MIIGDTVSVRCGDGLKRKGKVIYIHPEQIFAVVKFEFWCEAVMIPRISTKVKTRKLHYYYTEEEDKMILESKDLSALAERIGRTEGGLEHRKYTLKWRKQHDKPRKKALA